MASSEIKKHWSNVHELGCIITGNPECELHHAMSGSMSDYGISKGMGQKTNDYLIIPLIPELHRGAYGIHSGVKSWELKYGSQIYLLNRLCSMVGYDVFEKAGYFYDKENKRYEKA